MSAVNSQLAVREGAYRQSNVSQSNVERFFDPSAFHSIVKNDMIKTGLFDLKGDVAKWLKKDTY